MASLLRPVLRFYQFILYPVAKPAALFFDFWLGNESPEFFSRARDPRHADKTC
jgi:hypothetical protein